MAHRSTRLTHAQTRIRTAHATASRPLARHPPGWHEKRQAVSDETAVQQSVVIDDQAARVRPGGGPADGTPLYTTYSRPDSHCFAPHVQRPLAPGDTSRATAHERCNKRRKLVVLDDQAVRVRSGDGPAGRTPL